MKENENSYGTRIHGIRKAFRIYSPSSKPDGPEDAIIGLEISMIKRTFSVQILKGLPWYDNLILALLSDRHIRNLIAQYQGTIRKTPYKVIDKENPATGEHSIFIVFANQLGGFVQARSLKLMQITCGRVSEFASDHIYIGDFVELSRFLNLTNNMDINFLREKSGMEYIKPMLAEQMSQFKLDVSHIL